MTKQVLPLVLYPDKRLREASKPVDVVDDNIRRELDQMVDAVLQHDGSGLAAVQVGIMKRMFVVDHDSLIETMTRKGVKHNIAKLGKILTVVNPEITVLSEKGDTTTDWQGCLSLPGIACDITRPNKIRVDYTDYSGEKQSMEAFGLLSTCFQHELDHCNGVLFYDHLSPLKKNMMVKKMEKYIQSH
jgi:peptide deformylase